MTNPSIPPEQEPTVLDLYKSVTKDWDSFFNFVRSLWDARRREEINRALVQEKAQYIIEEDEVFEPQRADHFPWRSVLAFLLALIAQGTLEGRQGVLGAALYFFAAIILIWAHHMDEWHLPALPAFRHIPDDLSTRLFPILIAIVLALIAFVDFGGDKFSLFNVTVWVGAISMLAYGLWLKQPKIVQDFAPEERRRKMFWNVLVFFVFGLALFYRLYRTQTVPAEPFSDHAEKILDVYDVSQGQYNIFFPRNTGREAIQMYWTLLVAKVFGTGLSFLSLKLGTALLGIFTLPFVYMLGKEYGNERVALFALFLFGIAYWPNVIARIGLRFPLYPLFTAPTLLYLTRGLRTRNRNDFILAGLFLGLGLHGYSPFRIVPILIVVAFVLYMLHVKETRQQAVWWFVIIVVASLFVFLPLLRYWLGHPEIFGYRAFTRLSSVETPLPGPAWQIFLQNLYKGLLMFNWDDGEIWVNSMPHRPALDVVTGALFVLGLILLIVRYVRQRDWRDILLLVSIPVLLMPSVLSLAFPGENPALNRAGGGAVVGILISALALDGLVAGFGVEKKRQVVAYVMTGLLFAASAYQNFNIVFNQFDNNFRAGAWNSSEMGMVISQFRDNYGETDTVWIVPYPYWVDTRLPGVWAGIPNRDFAMWPDNLQETVAMPAPKLFIFWPDDAKTENALKVLYPNGVLSRYTSAMPGKDFMIFMVEK
jgi:4-amino-4-deoxy-L-arabinose transferase-like glycosyltransferase